MAAQKGRDFLFKFDTGGASFVAAAGQRNTSFTINNEPVDITTKDDATTSGALHRVLLAQAGQSSMSIAIDGVYLDDANFDDLRNASINNTHLSCQVTVSGAANDGILAGSFMVASMDMSGAHNAEVPVSMTLESAGEYTYTLNT